MKNRKSLIIVLLTFTLLLSACGNQPVVGEDAQKTAVSEAVSELLTQESKLTEEVPTEEVTPEMTEEPTASPVPDTATPEPTATLPAYTVGPTNFPADVNPLTGLKVSDPTILDRLPVMVKVPNFPAYGRPHGGLSAADIVFETWIGGGSNRFAALYYGTDSDNVWPIRSIRIVDPEIATLYNAVIAFSGGDPEKVMPKIWRIMDNRLFPEGTCPGICDRGSRDVTRLYANTAAITNYFKRNAIDPGTRPNLDGMKFSEAIPAGGKAASKLEFYFNTYNKGDWVFDQDSGKYLRWIEDGTSYEMIPLTDKNTEKQLEFSNVIMLFVDHVEIETQLIDIKVWGNTAGQRAVIFRDGQAFEATWKTSDNETPMEFFDKDGNHFPLKPGNTWVALTGLSSPESIDGTVWHYDFQMP